MKVICIDASNKPTKISLEEWIEEGVVYTVISMSKMGLQPNKIGFKLNEVELTERSFPYEYYDASRFLPIDGLIAYDKEHQIEEKEVELDII